LEKNLRDDRSLDAKEENTTSAGRSACVPDFGAVRVLYTFTLFLSSALLFLVQPMVGKMILPRFGGSPQVWNASLVFFQAALLLGYLYAHLATRVLGARRQAAVHLAVLALAVFALPVALREGAWGGDSPFGVLIALAAAIGVPFLVLSASAPLIQRWFAATDAKDAKDPYFLYSASNVGSMLALLAYPFVLEPLLPIQAQSVLWGGGYGVLGLLMVGCALLLWRSPPSAERDVEIREAPPVAWRTRLLWLALAAVPSSLLLAVTTFLTSNISPVPLLWIVPLALYLLTFIIAFAQRRSFGAAPLGRILPLLATPLALAIVLESSTPIVPLGLFHLAVFFIAALMCHVRLVEARPAAGRLTEFYLWMSLGGVLGGAFNALLAPALFRTLAEYPLALVLALLLRPPREADGRLGWPDLAYPLGVAALTGAAVALVRLQGIVPGPGTIALTIGIPAVLCFLAVDRRVRYGLSLGAIFLVSSLLQSSAAGRIVLTERSFFGVHRVVEAEEGIVYQLLHGTTIHGQQRRDLPGEPLTYYHRGSPIGHLFRALEGDPRRERVALVGLGVGSLAAYGAPGERYTFYEIDPVVERIARDTRYFTFVRDSRARIDVVIGDARLRLREAPEEAYGLIVLDAFSSDAIPVHLLTLEALELYVSRLRPGGLVAMHISNRYLDLRPVVGNLADRLGLEAWVQEGVVTDEEAALGKSASVWAVLARASEGFQPPGWWDPIPPAPHMRVWTDDYSNILATFKGNSSGKD
jgi:SAM-dependent methyltransferase